MSFNGRKAECNVCLATADREYNDCEEFRRFRRALFHGSLREILNRLRPGMEQYQVMRFADGHYRRVILGLGPYIGDYPEQVLLSCIAQGWCAKYVASPKRFYQ